MYPEKIDYLFSLISCNSDMIESRHLILFMEIYNFTISEHESIGLILNISGSVNGISLK